MMVRIMELNSVMFILSLSQEYINRENAVSYEIIDDSINMVVKKDNNSKSLDNYTLFVIKKNGNHVSITKNSNNDSVYYDYLFYDILGRHFCEVYVDSNQTEWSMFAMTPEQVYKNKELQESHSNQIFKRFTHCEIHPITAQGMISSLIPFSDHTPNPRNNYQCSMGKQAIGFSTTNYNSRFDNNLNILAYGQSPLVETKTMKYCMLDKLPHGEEAMLAIACYTGFNQEDSIIINKSSIDRGFFNTFNFRTFVEEENKQLSITTNEQFGIPPENKRKFGNNYDLIQ